MDNATRMRLRDGAGGLTRIVERVFEAETLPPDQIRQRLALDVLHGNEVNAIGLRDVVDRHDAGMVECRGSFRLLGKTLLAFRVSQGVKLQEFDRDVTVEMSVMGLVVDTHPISAQFSQNFVVGQPPANHWSGLSIRSEPTPFLFRV